MKGTRVTIALRRPAPTTAPDMENVSAAFALARMVGVVLTVLVVAPEMANVAVAMASAWRASATAIQDGPAMLATSALACMTARNMDTATMAHAFAKKDIEAVTAHSRLSPSLASVPFTACVAACSSAQKCTKPRELDRRTNATRSARRSACPSVWLERCLLIWRVPRRSRLSRQMSSLTSQV